jgi:hypothetical protein
MVPDRDPRFGLSLSFVPSQRTSTTAKNSQILVPVRKLSHPICELFFKIKMFKKVILFFYFVMKLIALGVCTLAGLGVCSQADTCTWGWQMYEFIVVGILICQTGFVNGLGKGSEMFGRKIRVVENEM